MSARDQAGESCCTGACASVRVPVTAKAMPAAEDGLSPREVTLLKREAGSCRSQQYSGVCYRVIPVIGPLFAANFAIGLAPGLALLAPIGRLGSRAPALAAADGTVFTAGTITALAISESGTLSGFHEHGRRLAIIVSVVFEGAAIVLHGARLLGMRRARHARRHAGQAPRPAVPARDRQVTRAGRPR